MMLKLEAKTKATLYIALELTPSLLLPPVLGTGVADRSSL